MIKELMKEIKNRNKKKSINITLGVIIGYILTGGIVYSEEISLKKKAVYDEEIKWLWPFEKGSGKKKLGENINGEELPPEPEVILPKKDEILWEHDPDGIVEDGLEQDSIDMYTGILKREWNKEEKKWKVVGLQDENGDGIADIYNPDGDFDGDGIENKYDKNWALNDGKQNDHFISSNGLGYVDSGNIIKILNKNDWNSDEIKSYLYSEGQQNLYKNGIKNLEDIDIKTVTKLNKYNEEYNKENKIVNSSDNVGNFENKLKEIGQNKLDEYNNFIPIDDLINGDGNGNYINKTNDIVSEQNSGYKIISEILLVNKGRINNANSLSYGAQGTLRGHDKVHIYNYGEIETKADNKNSKIGVHSGQYISGSAVLGEAYNYGKIKITGIHQSNNSGVSGQNMSTSESDTKYLSENKSGFFAYNYGVMEIENIGGGNVGGQSRYAMIDVGTDFNHTGNLYNYGIIITSNNGDNAGISGNYSTNEGQSSSGANIRHNLYNYGEINVKSGVFNTDKSRSRINVGQSASGFSLGYATVEIYNYGNINIEGENKKGTTDLTAAENNYGQYSKPRNVGSTTFEVKGAVINYGEIKIKSNFENSLSWGQISTTSSEDIKENSLYNYGNIDIDSTIQAIGQSISSTSVNSQIYNYGIINTEADTSIGQVGSGASTSIHNYGQIRVKGETQDTTGMKITDGAKGFNYGIIEVDNKDLTIENMGTGMWADGKDSEAFNYGSIVVTGLTGTVENGMDTAYMRATNGGKVYNYGWLELKDSLEALTIGEGVNSSTKAGYRSAGDFDLKGEMKIMAETGKGDIYSKENFITAGGNGKEGNISGLENLTSSGVYEISTIERKGDNGENVIDLVMNKTKNIENLEKDSNTRRMIKELKLDNAVYGKDSEFAKSNKEFSEMISRKVSEGESLENLLGFEYANLNGQIVESGKVLLENQEKVMNADRTYLSGQFNKENNFDAVIINPQNESKIGIFHLNSDKDLDSHASGTYRYDLESTTLILQNNKNYMIGMNYSKLDYKNRNSNMKKTSVFAGHNYTKSLGDISEYRNYLNGTLTFNSMDRNGKRDNFKSYTLNMRNEYVRELDIKGLTYSEFTAGLKTTVFGHEKIKEHGADLTSDRNIEVKEKIGISNEVNLGVLMNKSYELGKNKGKNNFGISTYLEYKKELMPIEDWRDEFTIGTGSYTKYNKPVKEHDLGVGLVVISARYEIKDELSGTLSFSADTLGDTMTTFKIEYKF